MTSKETFYHEKIIFLRTYQNRTLQKLEKLLLFSGLTQIQLCLIINEIEFISESQIPTQRYGRRPFGVGLLVAGYDDLGAHLYQTCPSANYYECKSMAIGARSQSARTYLEKHLNEFPENSCDELIRHALRALRDTLPNEIELSTKVNCVSGYLFTGRPICLILGLCQICPSFLAQTKEDTTGHAKEKFATQGRINKMNVKKL